MARTPSGRKLDSLKPQKAICDIFAGVHENDHGRQYPYIMAKTSFGRKRKPQGPP
jgi:hypothetical protein